MSPDPKTSPALPRKEDILLSSAEDLRALRVHPFQVRPRGLRLEAPSLPPSEAREWQGRLSRDYSDCGCGAGAAFTVAALAGCVLHVFFIRPGGARTLNWISIATGAGILMAGALSGKILGLLAAHLRLKRTIAELLDRLDNLKTDN